jgi:hypothetical protein
LRNPILGNQLRLNLAVMFVVNSPEQKSVFELWNRLIELSLHFKLLITDQGFSLILEFVNPRFFFEA